MNEKNHASLLVLYEAYNETLKPLLAEVESKQEFHPLPIFNELRSFFDHIARCYRPGVTEDYIYDELFKAKGHIKRAIFDCFKFLNVYYFDLFEGFEKDIRRVDITTINNGKFHVEYREIRQQCKDTVHEARRLETMDFEQAFRKYEEGYNTYVSLEDYLSKNYTNIGWARVRFDRNRKLTILLWLLSVILSGIISAIIPWTSLICGLGKLINKIF